MQMVRLAMLSILAGSAAAAAGLAAEETVIPFVSSIGSVEWKAASDKALYVRGGNGSWYFVRTTNRCTRLRAALAIGFETSALDQLDRHGAILVQGQRCPVASVTRSDGPPKKARKPG
jgi:Family of unknown function (DUF6491)